MKIKDKGVYCYNLDKCKKNLQQDLPRQKNKIIFIIGLVKKNIFLKEKNIH